MIYVFDDNSLSNILHHYYPDRFPSFWEKFDKGVEDGSLISVREVRLELTLKFSNEAIERLMRLNGDFFSSPMADELEHITEIYSVAHFRQNLDRKKLLKGGYFADPFVIAKAWKDVGTVVSEENFKENGAKIPNLCKHFGIECIKLEGFLVRENWRF